MRHINSRANRMVNLVLNSQFSTQNNDEKYSTSADNNGVANISPISFNNLITSEDLGLQPAPSSRSQSPSLLRLPTPTAAILQDSSSEEDESLLVLSTSAIVHSTLDTSHVGRKPLLVLPQTPVPKPLSPKFDSIFNMIDSDDSVQDPHWAPVSKKRRIRLPSSSDSEDKVQISSNTNLRENIPPTADIEDEIEPTQVLQKRATNIVQVNRKARVLGEAYLGFKKINDDKYKPCVDRPKRTLKPRCLHSKLSTDQKSKNAFMCALITDEEREAIHAYFWNLKTWAEKKTFVKSAAVRRGIRRRRRSNSQVSTKKGSGHDIFFNKNDEKCSKVKVCRLFFLNTLSLGEDSFRRWTKESDIVIDAEDSTASTCNDNAEKRITAAGPLLKYTERTKIVKTWLDLIPKVPSHYCRASSNKLYVEPNFRSEKHMHEVFVEWCREHNNKAVSRPTFLRILNQENIAIHNPRKDQCDTCCSFKTGNISQKEYDDHIVKKNEAREAKKNAIESANDKVVVITVDVQSVLLAPKLLASAVYYKLKLQCHNFTIYDCRTKNVTIYFWHEADGGVSANEFTSCLVDYMTNLEAATEKVIVISDGCGHQNRNRVLSSALSDLSQRNKIIIEQLYLEKGHTMMEVDSVHSTIERYIKPPIYAPSDYVVRMQQARPRNPYDVKSIHYDFFLNYEELPSNFKSIRPGKKKGDPVVVDVRGLKYLPDGSVLYKLRHTEEWTVLPQRRSVSREPFLPTPLYQQSIKITESKHKHLQELKSVVDKDYHPFYDSLSFNPGT